MCVLLFTAVAQDIRFGKISNRFIQTGLLMGFVYQVAVYHLCGIYYFLRNISVPIILFYLLFQMRVLGAGDIKLFSMIGSFVTIQELYKCITYSCIAGGLSAAFFLAVTPQRRSRCFTAIRYFGRILKTGRIEPYPLQKGQSDWKFAMSLPITAGVLAALYGF